MIGGLDVKRANKNCGGPQITSLGHLASRHRHHPKSTHFHIVFSSLHPRAESSKPIYGSIRDFIRSECPIPGAVDRQLRERCDKSNTEPLEVAVLEVDAVTTMCPEQQRIVGLEEEAILQRIMDQEGLVSLLSMSSVINRIYSATALYICRWL